MGPRRENAGRTRRDQEGPAACGLEPFLRGDDCTRSPTLPHTRPPHPQPAWRGGQTFLSFVHVILPSHGPIRKALGLGAGTRPLC